MSSLKKFESIEFVNNETRIPIWFDPNNEMEHLQKQFVQMNNDVIFHTELESYIHFMESIKKEKFFLIIPSSQFSLDIINYHQIEGIFIFCLNNDHLLFENSKIKIIERNKETSYALLLMMSWVNSERLIFRP
jgi:hypothetical protein